MIRVAISNPEIRELKGIAKVSGKPYHLRIQTAHAFVVDKDGVIGEFPDKFEIALDSDQPPYARGNYQLHPSSLQVGRDGRIDVRPRLVPLPAAKA